MGITKVIIKLNDLEEYFAVITDVALFLEALCHFQAILLKRGHHGPHMKKDVIITVIPINNQC